MGQLTRGQTIGVVALLAVVTGWVGVTALQTGRSTSSPGILVRESLPASDRNTVAPPPSTSGPAPTSRLPAYASGPSADSPGEIVVHVAGAVKTPGVYHLPPTARNVDAVQAAGGFTSAANSDAINLAAHSEDGSQLFVPTRSEQPGSGTVTPGNASTSPASPTRSSNSAAPATGAKNSETSRATAGKLSDPSQGQINLNTADSTQLQRIPGIGPAMAEHILAYRHTAGRFQLTEELLQIPGIGDKKYQRLKPFLTVR